MQSMMSMNFGVMVLGAAAALVSAQSSSSPEGALLSAVCSAPGVREPLCEVFSTSCAVLKCQPLSIGAALCGVNGDASQGSSLTGCSPIQAACAARPSDCSSAQAASYTASVPSAQIISSRIDSICKEMPGMTDCSTCPDPDRSTGISDCSLLTTYSKLCLDMPEMSQCSEWKRFCTSTSGLGPLCDSKTPFPTTTGNTTTSPTSSPVDKKSLAVGGPSVSFAIVALSTVVVVALSSL